MLGLLAHGFHLLLVVIGLVGVAYLLFPQVQSAARTSRRTPGPSEHERRVAALRAAVQNGQLTTPVAATQPLPSSQARDSSLWRGLAVGSSVAAAGAHAAVFPHHVEEAWYLGLFFLVVTLAQAAWSVMVTIDGTDGRVLVAGIAGSLGLVALWTVSRTVGLPFGLGREPVGGWDIACAVWELVIVGACAVGLRQSRTKRALVMGNLTALAWVWVALSGVVLVFLTLAVPQH